VDIFAESFILQSQTILLAEDDADDILIFKEVISDFLITVNLHIAQNGIEAIDLFNQLTSTDIIFLDINMLLMDGLECLTNIRTRSDSVAILMLSSSNSKDVVERSRQLGANGYITKPTNIDYYRTVIKEVLTIDWTKDSPAFYVNIQ
jgi:CheY-like chemotaxis protein